MNKILIIEDEEITALAIEEFLISLGYEITDCVNNAIDATQSIENTLPNLIISDIMIKGKLSGCELAVSLSSTYSIPIIFLTAYFDDEMLDYALDANAYGYILKPYKENELKAMVKLAIHNTQHYTKIKNHIIKFDNFVFDKNTHQLFQDEKVVKIGKKSLMLLKTLLETPNQTVSYETLIYKIYNTNDKEYIDRLRHLIKRTKDKLNILSIHSSKNIGYSIQIY